MKLHIRLFMIAASMLCAINVSAQIKRLPVFHAILFADTNDANIGKTTELDLNRISSMLVETQSSLQEEMEFKYYIYPGKYCSPRNLHQVLNGININPQDVVFFYYSGHGTRSMNDKSDYPQMCLGLSTSRQSEMVSVEGFDMEIAKKKPRLRFTISDCCNSVGEDISPKLEISKGASVVSSQTKANYKKLFLEKSGSVIMTSSRKGETSSCNSRLGGFFTFCLMYVMEQAVKQNVTDWDIIMKSTYNSTVNVSSGNMHPVYNVRISNNSVVVPTPATTQTDDSHIVTAEDNLLPALRQLIDITKTPKSRLAMTNDVLRNYFANEDAIVESLGRDSRTVVKTETSRDFVERLATEFLLLNFNIIKVSRNASGKVTHLRVHEIYKEN
ncbi:caspase family protein [Bacteroides muris (ex Fokt et al. 2023)]|uniref:Caspase family protein n=1 Tax=Bacteroides muris (ex Fokt et al. 2023) TaxID=2937417 RepID=A0A9X2NQC1_9BACE|nr:caspase family protein [Bacteroides muris (ex Fokt et al. 2023)]MCR6503990.1 caspase family protein [Bacteroides muris (ex Fokt et al. 2023)]